ncbi:MAG: hypothetical protein Q7T18_08340 [Sedimentisphaerales bacterium]|nr:hypothetical protein [Sedimentisphaerales bacterium]
MAQQRMLRTQIIMINGMAISNIHRFLSTEHKNITNTPQKRITKGGHKNCLSLIAPLGRKNKRKQGIYISTKKMPNHRDGDRQFIA